VLTLANGNMSLTQRQLQGGLLDDLRLMPDSDVDGTLIINTFSGSCVTTKNWILGRLMRDENDRFDRDMERRRSPSHEPSWMAVSISVYAIDDNPPLPHGVPKLDWVWFSGIAMTIVQLGVASVPWIIHGDWGVFLVASTGSLLAVAGASLPQWAREKWAGPKRGGSTIALTRGNGSRNVMVILGKKGIGLDFELLARGNDAPTPSLSTKVISAILALFWIALLILVSGMKENTWCRSHRSHFPCPKHKTDLPNSTF